MYQIDVSSVATTQPTSTALGTTGYFTDGNAATGLEATVVPAEFLNTLMLELMNAVTGAGLTLSKDTFDQLHTAIATVTQAGAGNYASDAGAVNAYAVTYTPTVTAPSDGMVRAFKVKTTNTGASTFTLDGQATAYPIVGLAGTALQGGELVATGIAVLRFNSTLKSWVLYHCGLAPTQVAPATASNHAANAAQVQASAFTTLTDTGAANSYVTTFSPALAAPVAGAPFWMKVKTANTGASTLNATGTAYPLLGGAHAALGGGELVAGGWALIVWNATLASYVLLECTGGPVQVGGAVGASQAAQLQQVVGIVGDSRNLSATLTTAGTSLTYTADNLIVKSALNGLTYCISSLNATIVSTATGAGGISSSSTMPASGFLAIYAIYNPTTATAALLGVNATSAKAPEICAATMPTGYTASALIGVWPTTSASSFNVADQAGRVVTSGRSAVINTSASASSLTAVSLASVVPANAKFAFGDSSVSATSTAANVTQALAATSSSIGCVYQTALYYAQDGWHMRLMTPQVLYYIATSTGTISSFVIYVCGYEF